MANENKYFTDIPIYMQLCIPWCDENVVALFEHIQKPGDGKSLLMFISREMWAVLCMHLKPSLVNCWLVGLFTTDTAETQRPCVANCGKRNPVEKHIHMYTCVKKWVISAFPTCLNQKRLHSEKGQIYPKRIWCLHDLSQIRNIVIFWIKVENECTCKHSHCVEVVNCSWMY